MGRLGKPFKVNFKIVKARKMKQNMITLTGRNMIRTHCTFMPPDCAF